MSDRAREALKSLVQTHTRSLPYAIVYPCTVLKDWGDGHLDLQPDNAEMPPMPRIPLKFPFPGLTLKLKEGARVLLHFEDADPDKPRCFVFESGTLDKIEVVTGLGHRLLMDDDRGTTSDDPYNGGERVEIMHKAGSKIELGPAGEITVSQATGATIVFDPLGNIDINPAPLRKLFYGGREVARIGDRTSEGTETIIGPPGP